MSKYLRPRTFAMLLLVLILAAAVYGFAAANTMPGGTNAGYGSEVINGYTVSAVQYRLQASDPRYIDQVTFTLAPATASSVYVGLVTGGTMYSCSGGGAVTCTLPASTVTALSADLLQIAATD